MWQMVERMRTVLQIIVALLTIAGALSLWLKFVVPGWLTILLVALGIGGGLVLGARTGRATASGLKPKPAVAVNRIGFKYPDEPTNHGWSVSHDPEYQGASAQFQFGQDAVLGRYVSIDASPGARVDYDLPPADYIADSFQLEYRPEMDATFYVRVSVSGALRSPNHHWINYKIGQSAPRRFTDNEWTVFVQPSPVPGQWLNLRCDIREHFDLTFGQDGLELDHVSGFRVRGKMRVAAITLYTSTPPVKSFAV